MSSRLFDHAPTPALRRSRPRAAARLLRPLCAFSSAGFAAACRAGAVPAATWDAVAQVRPWAWLALGGVVLLAAATGSTWLGRRRQAERTAIALRDSEERWKFALEGAGDGVWDANLASGTTQYTTRWKAMLGYAEQDIGTNASEWSERIHPEDRAAVLSLNQACVDGHSDGFVAEFRMRNQAGGWTWILDRGKVVTRGPDGRALRMIGTHTDISERRRTQLRDAARARVMTQIAQDAPLDQTLEAIVRGVEAASEWHCSLLLLDPSGQHLAPGAAPSLPEFFNQAIARMPIGPEAGSCGRAASIKQRVVSADLALDPRWAAYLALAQQAGYQACWSEPILSQAGEVLGTFAVYHRAPATPTALDVLDITEAAQLAAIAISRERVRNALLRSERRLSGALATADLALWDYDIPQGLVHVSPAWSEMLGLPRSETMTTAAALEALCLPEELALYRRALGAALRGETTMLSMEHRVLRPDGRVIWVLSQGRVVERDARGRALRLLGTNLEITARKDAEALALRLREAQKLEAIGTLAGGIAHDFNNITAAILGNVALAQDQLPEGHPAQARLQQIDKAGQRARSLVKQILAFSRMEPRHLSSHAVQPVLEDTAQMLRDAAGPQVSVVCQTPGPPLLVRADMTQLQQVLMNLGTNAWQALGEAGGRVELGLQAVRAPGPTLPEGLLPGPYVCIWVEDNGSGMGEETQRRIFEPFFTTKQVGQGTGLGLAVAHGIVEAHGGAIKVSSALGQGSRFDLFLPQVDQEPLEPLAAGPAETTSAVRGTGQHVLYIDDDEVMAVMVDGLLERLGYRCTCLLDPQQAIALVKRDPWSVDLVVTDYNMPHCTGLDVVRALATLRPDLPVAISSGYIPDELRAQAEALGVRGLMQKEHTLDALGRFVQAALQPVNRR